MTEKTNKKTLIEELVAAIIPEPKRRGRKKLRVGLAGDGWLLEPMAEAHRASGLCESLSYYHPDKKTAEKIGAKIKADEATSEFGKFSKIVEAAEVFEIPGGRDETVKNLLGAGVAVSLQKPFAMSIEAADDLIRVSKKTGSLLRVNEYALYYEPYIKLRELIRKMEIGEVCAIRLRSNLAGKGGIGPLPDALSGRSIFFHPAFDRFALAIDLVGDVESTVVYANGMDKKKGGQALAGFKCRQPGCYGIFDFTFAPGTSIRTSCLPCDDQVEIAGTDGIIWANHFHGKMTEEPWLEVRRGKKHYTIGIAGGIAVEWESALKASAEDFLTCAGNGSRPAHTTHESRRALKFLLAVVAASESGEMVKLQTATG